MRELFGTHDRAVPIVRAPAGITADRLGQAAPSVDESCVGLAGG